MVKRVPIWTIEPDLWVGDIYDFEDIPRGEILVKVGSKVKIWQTRRWYGNITIPYVWKKGKWITIEEVYQDDDGDDWIVDQNGRHWDVYRCMINW